MTKREVLAPTRIKLAIPEHREKLASPGRERLKLSPTFVRKLPDIWQLRMDWTDGHTDVLVETLKPSWQASKSWLMFQTNAMLKSKYVDINYYETITNLLESARKDDNLSNMSLHGGNYPTQFNLYAVPHVSVKGRELPAIKLTAPQRIN